MPTFKERGFSSQEELDLEVDRIFQTYPDLSPRNREAVQNQASRTYMVGKYGTEPDPRPTWTAPPPAPAPTPVTAAPFPHARTLPSQADVDDTYTEAVEQYEGFLESYSPEEAQELVDEKTQRLIDIVEVDRTPSGTAQYPGILSTLRQSLATGRLAGPVQSPIAKGLKARTIETPEIRAARREEEELNLLNEATQAYAASQHQTGPDLRKKYGIEPFEDPGPSRDEFIEQYIEAHPITERMLTAEAKGKTIESTTAQLLRATSAPLGWAAGIGEGIGNLLGFGEARGFSEAIEERITEGEGLASGAEDAADYGLGSLLKMVLPAGIDPDPNIFSVPAPLMTEWMIGDTSDKLFKPWQAILDNPDSSDTDKAWADHHIERLKKWPHVSLSDMAWMSGFVGEFAVPIDLGAGKGLKGVGVAARIIPPKIVYVRGSAKYLVPADQYRDAARQVADKYRDVDEAIQVELTKHLELDGHIDDFTLTGSPLAELDKIDKRPFTQRPGISQLEQYNLLKQTELDDLLKLGADDVLRVDEQAAEAVRLRETGSLKNRLQAARIEEMLKPETTRLSELGIYIKETFGKAARWASHAGDEPNLNAITDNFIKDIKNKFGSIDDTYRSEIARATKQNGGDRPAAFGEVLIKSYKDKAGVLGTKNVDRLMVNEFVTALYDGYETWEHVIGTLGARARQSGNLSDVRKKYQLINVATRVEGDNLHTFIKALGYRDHRGIPLRGIDKVELLGAFHKTIKEKSLGSIIDREKLKAFVADIDNKPWLDSVGLTPTGVMKIYDDVAESSGVVLNVDEAIPILSTMYIKNKQFIISRKTIDEYAENFPLMFPSRLWRKSGFAKQSEGFGSANANEFDKLSDLIDQKFGDLFKVRPKLSRTGGEVEAGWDLVRKAVLSDRATMALTGEFGNALSKVMIKRYAKYIDDAVSQVADPVARKKVLKAYRKSFKDTSHDILANNNWAVDIFNEIKTTPIYADKAARDNVYNAIIKESKTRRQIDSGSAYEELREVPILLEGYVSKTGSTRELGKAAHQKLTRAVNVEDMERALRQMRINPKFVTDPSFGLGDNVNEVIETLLENAKKVDADNVRFTKFVTDNFVAAQAPGDLIFNTLSGFNNVAKAGVLGGLIAPNMGYQMVNALTANAIIHSTIGGRYMNRGLADCGVVKVMKYTYGRLIPCGGRVLENSTILKTPSGRIYTAEDISNLIINNSIGRTQTKTEIQTNILEGFVRYAGMTASGKRRSEISNLIRIHMNPAHEINILGQIANTMDVSFRTGVVMKALREGKTEATALELGRQALFDYGSITQFERTTINKVIWFYTFMRQNLVTVLKNLINTPDRLAKQMKLARGIPEYDNGDWQYHDDLKTYAVSKPFIKLTKGQDGSFYGPSWPLVGGTQQMIDIISLGTLVVGSSPAGRMDATTDTLAMIGGMSNPIVGTGLGVLTGKEVAFGDVREHGTYLDPRLVAWAQTNEQSWDFFKGYVKVEPVPVDEMKFDVSTHDGMQWRIPKKDTKSRQNWFLIKQIVLQTGWQRMLREYGGFIRRWTADPERENLGPKIDLDSYTAETLRQLGVISYISEDEIQTLPARSRYDTIRELKE